MRNTKKRLNEWVISSMDESPPGVSTTWQTSADASLVLVASDPDGKASESSGPERQLRFDPKLYDKVYSSGSRTSKDRPSSWPDISRYRSACLELGDRRSIDSRKINQRPRQSQLDWSTAG